MIKFLKKLLAGAGVGFFVGGPPGAILGAIFAGAMADNDDFRNTSLGHDRARMIFVSNLTVMLTLVAKADDKISPEAARTIARFFKEQLNFGEQELQVVRNIMKETVRQNPAPFAVAQEFSQVSHVEERLTLLRILWMVAESDGPATASQQNIIQIISRGLGVGDRHNRAASSEFGGNDDHYKVLGLNKKASTEEVKKAYRTMAKQYHPDRVSHLGEDFIKIANEKFGRINKAYEEIKKERGI